MPEFNNETADIWSGLLSAERNISSNNHNNDDVSAAQLQQRREYFRLQTQIQRVDIASDSIYYAPNGEIYQFDRNPRRETYGHEARSCPSWSNSILRSNSSHVFPQTSEDVSSSPSTPQFLLANLEELSTETIPEETRREHSQFVQELFLSAATQALRTQPTSTESVETDSEHTNQQRS